MPAPPSEPLLVQRSLEQGLVRHVGVDHAPVVHVAAPEAVKPLQDLKAYVDALAAPAPPSEPLLVLKSLEHGLAWHVGVSQAPGVHVASPDAVKPLLHP